MKRKLLVGVATAVLVGFYLYGTFDRVLYNVGLNFHACGRNGFGATFCGRELDEYRARIEHVKEVASHAREELAGTERKINEESATREREAEATKASEDQAKERSLEAKLHQERTIFQSEPEGSAASDLAKAEYEAARAELQQMRVSAGAGKG